MFSIDADKTIHITRGDIGIINARANVTETEEYIFHPGDVVRLRVYVRKQHANVVLVKDVIVESETPTVEIGLGSTDTRIGDIIDKPVDYWYEIEINPDTAPQTIIGYDKDGPKIFKLYPEAVNQEGSRPQEPQDPQEPQEPQIPQVITGVVKTINGLKPDEDGNIEIRILPNNAEQINMLIEVDMLPAVYDTNETILTDEKGNIVLRY